MEVITTLRAVGFCGADDSIHPNLLVLLSRSYPLVEFGVLFRPDKEGQPRYASISWIEKLAAVVERSNNNIDQESSRMKLAAHFCGSRVHEVLNGDDKFIEQVQRWGFQRIQINATAVNGVDTSSLGSKVLTLKSTIQRHPSLEFILQKNEETKPLWQGLLDLGIPRNVSMLVDESKGTGVASLTPWPSPSDDYEIGYAGGIGPHNIERVLHDVKIAAQGRTVWIDMESRVRSIKNNCDVFDLDKCYDVIFATCEAGLMPHPAYL